MKFSPEEFAKSPRDSRQESEVLLWLRQQGDGEKFEFVWRVLRNNAGMGLLLAERGQLKPVFLEVIFEHGFVYADASGIRWWLDAVVNGLGHRRLLRLVRDHLSDAPLAVHKTLYWLPALCESQPEALEEARALAADFKLLHPDFQSSRSTGLHATKVLNRPGF